MLTTLQAPPKAPSLREGADVLTVARGRAQAELLRELAAGKDGWELGALHARRLGGILAGQLRWTARTVPIPRGFAIAAVGSLGRGAVALGSDADVRLLVPDGGDDVKAFVDALLYPLWDAKLPIGHQVATQSELLALAPTDLPTATALVDLRHVAGDPARVSELRERAFMGLFGEEGIGEFVDGLEEEATARHAKFGGSVYLLEPDVKSGPGGLRDVEGARWAARARFHVAGSAPSGEQGTWGELVRMGVLVAREARGIAEAEELLWRVRNRLHAHAGRRSDRLTFDAQETIAAELGYATGDGDEARALGAEAFMQDYYRKARVVMQARELIFERARVRRRASVGGAARVVDLGDGMRLSDGAITVSSAGAVVEAPAVALRLYAEANRQGVPVHAYARSAITRAAADPAWCAALRASPEAARLFVDLACRVAEAPARRGSIMTELLEIGVLLAMVPEFTPVTGRVHHDVYHVYTVDVHSVAALDCLRALARGELAQEHPLASRLAAEIARPAPLFLATLLHDIGKGYPDAAGSRKNHSVSGAELCEKILPRFGFGADDIADARALVALHLAMYHVATRRDLDDKATVEEFVRPIRSRELLRDLYLLTIADITTTSPTAMTAWKARMLEELYRAADAELAGDARLDRDVERTARMTEEAMRLWRGDPAELDAFVASMPQRYLLSNPVEAVVAHASVVAARGSAKVHAELVPSRHKDVAELCVVAEDRPGLLARIAAAITAGRLEVHGAQVYSRVRVVDGASTTEAVDIFWVRDRVDGAEGALRAMPRLSTDLEQVVREEGDVAARLLRARGGSPWRERPSPRVATEVVLDDRASPHHTVVEVFAKDRPGLLYTLAQTLHDVGLSIAVSKINTEGTRVADVFYVQERRGGKVLPGERFKEIARRLREAIDEG